MEANDNNNFKGTIFSNGNPISEISSKWGETSDKSKYGNKNSISKNDLINIQKNNKNNKE